MDPLALRGAEALRLCVLNYQVTSNHVHLLIRDRGAGEIERSMQLIASCTGQAYNREGGRVWDTHDR